MSGVLRALDIAVHASTEPEPFGLVIAEAMACGRPVVTTANGGAAELIEVDRDALVAPSGDPRALATAIERLAGDAGLRDSLGAHARAAALARFSPARMVADVVSVLETAGVRRLLAQSA